MLEWSHIGQQSRKTGIRAKNNTRLDAQGMEDVNDFFSDAPAAPAAPVASAATLAAARYTLGLPVPDSTGLARAAAALYARDRQLPLRSPLQPTTQSSLSFEGYQDFGMGFDNHDSDQDSAIMDVDSDADALVIVRADAATVARTPPLHVLPDLHEPSDGHELTDLGPEPASAASLARMSSGMALGRSLGVRKPARPTQPKRAAARLAPKPARTPRPRTPSPHSSLPPLVVIEDVALPLAASAEAAGLRRSSRHRVKPVKFWRNESVLYKSTNTDGMTVQEVAQVVLHPDKPEQRPQPRGRRSRRTTPGVTPRATPLATPRTTPRTAAPSTPQLNLSSSTAAPRWLARGHIKGDVMDTATHLATKERFLAFAPGQFTEHFRFNARGEQSESGSEDYSLEVLFRDFVKRASLGIFVLPPNKTKPDLDIGGMYMMFHVLQGEVEVSVAKNTFVVVPGCLFQLPSFNSYRFRNVGPDDVRMFFVQLQIWKKDGTELEPIDQLEPSVHLDDGSVHLGGNDTPRLLSEFGG